MTKGAKRSGVQGVGGLRVRGLGVQGAGELRRWGSKESGVQGVGRRETAMDVEPTTTEN